MKVLRCAVYTRKSTEDGLEQEFNSLDAQREACEAYITSQRHEGCVDTGQAPVARSGPLAKNRNFRGLPG